jgi:hypothetical protein
MKTKLLGLIARIATPAVRVLAAASCLFLVASNSVANAGTIFSNLGPGSSYFCCGGTTISGSGSGLGNNFFQEAFTASITAAVSQIDVAVSNVSGTNSALVQLTDDVAGFIGPQLGAWTLTNLPSFGSASTIQPSQTISGINGINLTAGTSYFLIVSSVSPTNDTYDAWNNSGTGPDGFDVLSSDPSTTPLPTALPLFATGLGAMGLFGWRRKRKNAAALAAA